jgi:hypothetical protein
MQTWHEAALVKKERARLGAEPRPTDIVLKPGDTLRKPESAHNWTFTLDLSEYELPKELSRVSKIRIVTGDLWSNTLEIRNPNKELAPVPRTEADVLSQNSTRLATSRRCTIGEKGNFIPLLKKTQDVKKCIIHISREELFRLHDIADGFRLLRDISEEAPEMRLIQAELLIKKTSHCAWNLICEELDIRWQE